jgi:hypothetical protein
VPKKLPNRCVEGGLLVVCSLIVILPFIVFSAGGGGGVVGSCEFQFTTFSVLNKSTGVV